MADEDSGAAGDKPVDKVSDEPVLDSRFKLVL
jgi:hypothetical protein